jgi:LssY C-terminus
MTAAIGRRRSAFGTALLFLSVAPAIAAPAELPAGTELSVRLTSAIPAHANAGQPVTTVLVVPVTQAGVVILPSGVTVSGVVEAAGELRAEHRHRYLQLAFDEIRGLSSRPLAIQARVAEVDNARETVDPEGRIVGLGNIRARPTAVDALLLLAAHGHPIAFVAAEAGKLGLRAVERAPIEYDAGTELTLKLLAPVSPPSPSPGSGPDLPDLSRDPVLERLASALPVRAVTARLKQPADLTNVLLLGTGDDVREAFLAAGWTEARPLGVKSVARAFLALAHRHGYKPASVSRQELQGAPPDLVFEKQNNTLAKRHHVRIWSREERFRGETVWLGAASHDVAIFFDRKRRTFTHRIDPRIDDERDKIMSDLAFTGRVRAAGLVERPDVAAQSGDAPGDAVVTDGRLGVLRLATGSSCRRPARAAIRTATAHRGRAGAGERGGGWCPARPRSSTPARGGRGSGRGAARRGRCREAARRGRSCRGPWPPRTR